MKDGLIIINGYSEYESTKHQVRRLLEEFSNANVNVSVKKTTDIVPIIENGNISINLPKYDFVVYLDKDKYLADVLTKCGYKLFNSAKSIELCDDKMVTHLSLINKGIDMPKTISAPLCYVNSGDYSYLDKVIEQLGYPIVVKECFGSKGAQVFLANNMNELLEIENSLRFKAHLFQQFIKPGGVDYRLIVINHKVIASMKRENKNDFRSNVAQGGSGTKVELSNEIKELAIKSSEVLGLDYCGVDILIDENNNPMVCEVNSNAFFEGIEKATNVNVAKLYVKHIINVIE